MRSEGGGDEDDPTSREEEGHRTHFPTQPCQTHTSALPYARTQGPPWSAVCARWGCDTWLLSRLPSLHQHSHSSCTTTYCTVKIQWYTTWGGKQCHLHCTQGKGVFNQMKTKVKGYFQQNHATAPLASLWARAGLNTSCLFHASSSFFSLLHRRPDEQKKISNSHNPTIDLMFFKKIKKHVKMYTVHEVKADSMYSLRL